MHIYTFCIILNYINHIDNLWVYLRMVSEREVTQKNPLRCNYELRRIFAIKSWQAYPFLTKTYALTAALAELSNKL